MFISNKNLFQDISLETKRRYELTTWKEKVAPQKIWRHKNEEWERNPKKKEMNNPSFLWRHMLIFRVTFSYHLTTYNVYNRLNCFLEQFEHSWLSAKYYLITLNSNFYMFHVYWMMPRILITNNCIWSVLNFTFFCR